MGKGLSTAGEFRVRVPAVGVHNSRHGGRSSSSVIEHRRSPTGRCGKNLCRRPPQIERALRAGSISAVENQMPWEKTNASLAVPTRAGKEKHEIFQRVPSWTR